MNDIRILWADDEIELLKSQVVFLNTKGYEVIEVSNGRDAIELCDKERPDIIFLDENMPGLSGLETLAQLKTNHPLIPVVMITKSEEENIMEDAIGQQIADYLIKPVHPKQILLTIKRVLDNKRLVSERTTSDYRQEFQKIFMAIQENNDHSQWAELWRTLVKWELKLEESDTDEMKEVFEMQKQEADRQFSKFVVDNYEEWFEHPQSAPQMTNTLLENLVFPKLEDGIPTFFLLIDNFRYDQWKAIEPLIANYATVQEEHMLYSILPTSTQYSRNAIFSGLMPREIQRKFPKHWLNDEEPGGKNMHEELFLENNIKNHQPGIKFTYQKIASRKAGQTFADNILNLMKNDLNVIVYNFVDMLSHARTEMEVLKELARDDAAFRSLTTSWFIHSPIKQALDTLKGKKFKLIIATDHGTKLVASPSKVIGDKNTTTNLRYKTGKSLQYDPKDVLYIRDPEKVGLPKPHISSSFIFAKEDKYFVYPNNYNHFVKFFKDTFQHGGISMEEMLIPLVVAESR